MRGTTVTQKSLWRIMEEGGEAEDKEETGTVVVVVSVALVVVD